jgi:hypothetical protein
MCSGRKEISTNTLPKALFSDEAFIFAISIFYTLENRIQALVHLGQFLQKGLNNKEFDALFEQAYLHNNWFTHEFCHMSFQSLANHYFEEENIRKWLEAYTIADNKNMRKVGLILAGNIPLVGIHDIISVFVSGHTACIKLSKKDSILNKFIMEKLASYYTSSHNPFILTDELKDVDALIATGSDNSARYFDYYFKDKARIIRKNRSSVALLTGKESPEDLRKLETDIFSYFGLGCRNVSKLYLPRNYDLEILLKSFNNYNHFIDHHKYFNNYLYHKSIFTLNLDEHLDNGHLILKESEGMHSPLSVLFYTYYDDLEEVRQQLQQQQDQIQVMVAAPGILPQAIPFGQSQQPALWDYADNVDTLNFLLKQL